MMNLARSRGIDWHYMFITLLSSFLSPPFSYQIDTFVSLSDWNTASDEESIPQLRQVSCAALACYLHHCGLTHYALNHPGKPRKELIDVYRAVFSLRKEIFMQRPVPNSEGEVGVVIMSSILCLFVDFRGGVSQIC